MASVYSSNPILFTLSVGNFGLVDDEPVSLQNHVYVASGDVVGLYMNNPTFLATLVYSGSDTICTSESDTTMINCSVTSPLRLRVQAKVGKFDISLTHIHLSKIL